MRTHKQYIQEPLTPAEMLLLRKDPEKFVNTHPERVMLQMKKNNEGNFEVSEIAIVVR